LEKINEPFEKQIEMNKFVKDVMRNIKEKEFIDDYYVEKKGELTRQDEVYSKKTIPDIDKEMRVMAYKNLNEEALSGLFSQYSLMKLRKKLMTKRDLQIEYYKNYPTKEEDIDEEYEKKLKLITLNSEDSIKRLNDSQKKRSRLNKKKEDDFRFLKNVCEKNTLKVTSILDINDSIKIKKFSFYFILLFLNQKEGINFVEDDVIKSDSVMVDKHKKKLRMIKKNESEMEKLLEKEEQENKPKKPRLNSKASSAIIFKFSDSK
jgi:hypothetical protein